MSAGLSASLKMFTSGMVRSRFASKKPSGAAGGPNSNQVFATSPDLDTFRNMDDSSHRNWADPPMEKSNSGAFRLAMELMSRLRNISGPAAVESSRRPLGSGGSSWKGGGTGGLGGGLGAGWLVSVPVQSRMESGPYRQAALQLPEQPVQTSWLVTLQKEPNEEELKPPESGQPKFQLLRPVLPVMDM